MDTCCNTSSRGDLGTRHRAGEECGSSGDRAWDSDTRRVLRRSIARTLVAERGSASLIAANNVLAQVPDLNDFVAGIKILLGRAGCSPSNSRTCCSSWIRTSSTRSITNTSATSRFCGLEILALTACASSTWSELADARGFAPTLCVPRRGRGVQSDEQPSGGRWRLRVAEEPDIDAKPDRGFGAHVEDPSGRILDFLIAARRAGQAVAGYGAPGKGTHFSTIAVFGRPLEYTVDRNPYKHGPFLPGTQSQSSSTRTGFERDPAGFILDPSLEPAGRDCGPAVIRAGVGWHGSSSRFRRPIPVSRRRSSRHEWGKAAHEGRAFLRRPGHAHARRRRDRSQADGADRLPADPAGTS